MALPKKLTEELQEDLIEKFYTFDDQDFEEAILYDDRIDKLKLTQDQTTEYLEDMFYRRQARILSDNVDPVRQKIDEVTDASGHAIPSDVFLRQHAPTAEDILRASSGLREVDSEALRAHAEGDLNSLKRLIRDKEDIRNEFDSIVSKETRRELNSYKEQFEKRYGMKFDDLPGDIQTSHILKLQETVKSGYYAPIFLDMPEGVNQGKYYIDDLLEANKSNRTVAGLLQNIKNASMQQGLKEIESLQGYSALANFIGKASSPTIRLDLDRLASEDVTEQELQDAVEMMQKYGVSEAFDPNIPKMELANKTAKAIANLRKMEEFGEFDTPFGYLIDSLSDSDKLQYQMLSSGFAGETQIPPQQVKDIDFIRSQEMDSMIANKRVDQYRELSSLEYKLRQSIKEKTAEELFRDSSELLKGFISQAIAIENAKRYVTLEGALEQDTQVDVPMFEGSRLDLPLMDQPKTSNMTFENLEGYKRELEKQIGGALAANENLTEDELVRLLQRVYGNVDVQGSRIAQLQATGDETGSFLVGEEMRRAGQTLPEVFKNIPEVEITRSPSFFEEDYSITDEAFREVPFGGKMVDLTKSEMDIAINAKENSLRREIANARSQGKNTEELEEKLKEFVDLRYVMPLLEKRDEYIDPNTRIKTALSDDFREKVKTVVLLLNQEDSDMASVLDRFFPTATTNLIVEGYSKNELADLLNTLVVSSQYQNQAANIMGDDPQTNNWDSVRMSEDFQASLRAGDLNAAMEELGSLTVFDLPRYLTDLRDETFISEDQLKLPINELYKLTKDTDSPIFTLEDLVYADDYRNQASTNRGFTSNVVKIFSDLTTRTEYDNDSNTIVVRPSSSTMSLMNVLGAGKEYLEVIDPMTISILNQMSFGTLTPLIYTPDLARLVETISPDTRMQGFVFGGVADDIKQNMLNKRRDLSVEEIDFYVGNVVAEMQGRNISEFASLDDLNAYTKERYGAVDAFQIFDEQSVKLLLGTDRFSQTFMGIPYKPTFFMPNSFQETMLAQNGKYTPLFDYENTTTFDRAIAMYTLGQEGAMGFARFRAEQAGYSPLTSGYVKAQAVGTASDTLVDPIDKVAGGFAKTTKVLGGLVKRTRKMKGTLSFGQILNASMMELSTNDDLLGFIGRSYVDSVREGNDAFKNALDGQIRQGVEAQVAQTKPLTVRTAAQVAGRAAAIGSLSLLIGTEGLAEVVTQQGIRGFAKGSMRAADATFSGTGSLTDRAQMPFAKALEEATGYQGYTDYVLGRSYLGSKEGLQYLTPSLISVPAEMMVGMYHYYDLKDTHRAGESLYVAGENKADRANRLNFHKAFFDKIGIDLAEVQTIMETQAVKQHPRILQALTILDDDPLLKQFEAASKKYGFDKFFDDFELDETQRVKMMQLFVAHAGDQDMDTFVRNLTLQSTRRTKKPDLRADVLDTIRRSNEENPVYNEDVYNSMPKAQQDYIKRLGIDYEDNLDLATVETLIDNRNSTEVKYFRRKKKPIYQMSIKHEGQLYRVEVSVKEGKRDLRIKEIRIIRDEEQKRLFNAGIDREPSKALVVQSLMRYLTEKGTRYKAIIVEVGPNVGIDKFRNAYTRVFGISKDSVTKVTGGYRIPLRTHKRLVGALKLRNNPIVTKLKPVKKQPFVTESQLKQTQANISEIQSALVEAKQKRASSLSNADIGKLEDDLRRGRKKKDIIFDYFGSPKRQAVEEYLNYDYDKVVAKARKVGFAEPFIAEEVNFSKDFNDAEKQINALESQLSAAQATYESLGGDPRVLEQPTVLERDSVDEQVQSALNEQRRELASDDIDAILKEQSSARFYHVRDDGLHIFKGPADGNIQVRFFTDANGQQIMTIEKIGMANVNDVVSLLEGQLNTADAEVAQKAIDQLYSKLEEQTSFETIYDMLSNEYRNLSSILQYAIDEGISIAYPTRLDGSVGNVILNELAFRLGTDRFNSKVENLVTHNNILYRSIDMEPLNAAKRSRKGLLPEEESNRINGDNFGRAEKVIQGRTNKKLNVTAEDKAILEKWIGKEDPEKYLTTTRVNADITMMGMNRIQVDLHLRDLQEHKRKLDEAAIKYGQKVQEEIDSIIRAIETITDVTERQPPSSIVVQTPDDVVHTITYTHPPDTDTLVFDVSNVDDTYADVVTNAIVRHATSYANITDVDFVFKSSEFALELEPTAFVDAKKDIYERWGATDTITDEMRDSVPSRGQLFAPRTPHGSLKKLGKYASNLNYKYVDARDARVASDLVGKTNDGKDPLASLQLSNRIEDGRQVGAVFYGKDTSYDEAVFAIHDQPLQHIIVTDAQGPIQKTDVTLVEKFYTKKQAGTARKGPVARRDVRAENILEQRDEQLEVVWTKEKGYLIEPRNQYGRSFDVNMETIGNRIKTAKAPVIAINAPYGYMDAITPLSSLLAEINKSVDAGGVDLGKTVQIDIIQPSGVTRIQTTLQKLLTDDPANLAAQTVKNKINELSIKFRNEKYFVVDKFIISNAQKIYNDQSMEMISSIFESLSSNEIKAQQWTNIGLDDVKNTVATKHGFEPVLYTDRSFSGDVPEPNLSGTYSIDFIHRTDIKQSPFLRDDGIFKRRRYLKGGYKYGYEAVPYGQYEQAKQVDGGFYIRTSDGLEVDTRLFDKARIQEPAPDQTTRIRYSTQMMGRRYYNDGYSGMSPVLTNVFRPFRDYALDMTKKNIVSDDELLTLIFGDVNDPGRVKGQDDALLDLMQVLSATMRDNLNRMINGDLKPSDIFNAYLSAVYSQQVGKIDRRTLKKKMTEVFMEGDFKAHQRVLLTVLADELFADVVKEAGFEGLEQAYRELGLDMKQSVILDTFKQNASFFDDDNVFIKTESLPQMWANYTVEGLAFMQELDENIMSGVFIDDIRDMQSLNQALLTPYTLREMFGRSNVKEPGGKFWYQQVYKLYWETQEISKQLRSKKGPITQEDLKQAMDRLYKRANQLQGLGNVKTPFMLSLLGLGHKTTMDSRQVNALFGSFMADPETKKSTTRPVAKTASPKAVESLRYKRMFEGLLVYEELFDANERLAPFTERLPKIAGVDPLDELLEQRMESFLPSFAAVLRSKYDASAIEGIIDPTVLPYVVHQLIWGRISDMLPHEIAQLELHLTLGVKPESGQLMRQVLELLTDSPYSPDLLQWIQRNVMDQIETGFFHVKDIEHFIDALQRSPLGQMPELGLVNQAIDSYYKLYKDTGGDLNSYQFTTKLINESIQGTGPRRDPLDLVPYRLFDDLKNGRSFFKMEDGKPFIFLDDEATLHTFLHENGHLLEALLGDKHYQNVAVHLDHVVGADGRLMLTRKGQEQFAEFIANMILEGEEVPPAFETARPFLARQVNKLSQHFGRILGYNNDQLKIAAKTTTVKNPKYNVEASADLQSAIQAMAAEVAAKADNRQRLAMGAPRSEQPKVKLSSKTEVQQYKADVGKAEIKEALKTENLTSNDVLRELLPSRWEAFKKYADADKADKMFLENARTNGLDVVDAAIKIEAIRIRELFAESAAKTTDPLVAVTKQSVVPTSMVLNVAFRARTRMEDAFGMSMDRLRTFTKVDSGIEYYQTFDNQLDQASMPYIQLTGEGGAGVDVTALRNMIETIENGPMRTRVSERLKRDLAGNGPHKLYLNEIEGIRDGLIDNAISTARARNRKLENIPPNLVSAVAGLFKESAIDFEVINSMVQKFKETFINLDLLEGVVTPQYLDVLRNLKDRTKIVEDTFKAMFEEARSRVGKPSRRSIVRIMQEMRRMLNPPVKISDVTLIMELSRNFNEFVNMVHTNPTFNTLYTKTLSSEVIDQLVSQLSQDDVVALSQQIQDLRDYVSLRESSKGYTGRIDVIAEDAMVDIYNALSMQNKSDYKAFFVQSYVGSKSSVLNQIEKMLINDKVRLTTQEELEIVRQLKGYSKKDLVDLNKRKEIEVLIVQMFEIVNRRKRLVERRGDKILQSMGVPSAKITSEAKAKAYTLFYTGKFSVNDYELSQMAYKDAPYKGDAPPDGYAWKASDIRDIAIQFGYFSSGDADNVRLSNRALQEIFNVIGIQAKANKLDEYDADTLASIANQLATGTPKRMSYRQTLYGLAKTLGGTDVIDPLPARMTDRGLTVPKFSEQRDATSIYFELITRMLAEDVHLGAAEEMFAVYKEGDLDKLIASRIDVADFDPITETTVFKELVIQTISDLLVKGDVQYSISKSGFRELTPVQQRARNLAVEILDAAGFTRRQTESPAKEMILPDGSRIVIHEEVEKLFDGLMSDFAPVGVSIRKGRPVDSVFQMVRRQFGELRRLVRKANAADEILQYMSSADIKSILGEELVNDIVDSDVNFDLITNEEQLDAVFNKLYENTLHVNEAVNYFLYREGLEVLDPEEFTPLLSAGDKRRLLTNAYQDAVFVKNNVSVKQYEDFLASKNGYGFSQKVSIFAQALIASLGARISDYAYDPSKPIVFALLPGVLQTFKQAVTSGYILPNLRYYLGNFIGGISQLVIGRGFEGVLSVVGTVTRNPLFFLEVMYNLTFGDRSMSTTPRVMVAADGTMYTSNMITNMMTENSVGSSMVVAELGRQLQDDLVGSEMWRTSALSASTQGPVRAISNLNSKIFLGTAEALDNIYRVSLFMERLDNGVPPSVAAKEVRRVMFDYADLSEIEKNTFRQAFTFYSFLRKNTGLIISELLTNPSRVLGQMRLIRNSVKSNIEEGYAEYAVSDYYHSRLALFPGTPIYNFLRSDSGGYTLTVDALIHNSRIRDDVLLNIKNAIVMNPPPQNIVQLAQSYGVDLPNLLVMFEQGQMTDADVAIVLGFLKPNGRPDIQRFVDEYDLVRHSVDQVSYTFELYTDQYKDKMYILPALNAPDGFSSILSLTTFLFSASPEGAQGILNNFSPVITTPLEVATEKSFFGMREMKEARKLPVALVENPAMSFLFQDADATVQEEWLPFMPKVRIRKSGEQKSQNLLRAHKYGDEFYEFKTNEDAARFLVYSTILSAHPFVGRSEQQTLQLVQLLKDGEVYIPPGMTLAEYIADTIGLRNVPIKTYDAQMQQAIYSVIRKAKEVEGRVSAEDNTETPSEINRAGRIEAAEIKADTEQRKRELME